MLRTRLMSRTHPLPAQPGTYALVLASRDDGEVRIGRLGVLKIKPGFYVYPGSAQGPGGLAGRVLRHGRTEKKLHWHIDYLRENLDITEVWYSVGSERRECLWAAVLLAMSGGGTPLRRFGASDCDCPTHLLFFESMPSWPKFRRRLRRATTDCGPVVRVPAGRLGSDHDRC